MQQCGPNRDDDHESMTIMMMTIMMMAIMMMAIMMTMCHVHAHKRNPAGRQGKANRQVPAGRAGRRSPTWVYVATC